MHLADIYIVQMNKAQGQLLTDGVAKKRSSGMSE
jgi:hypothetical protein